MKQYAAAKSPTTPSALRQRKAGQSDADTTPAEKRAFDAPTKSEMLIASLRRPDGATIAQMGEATGWLPHSVRGFMAGTLRRRYGLSVTSEMTEGGRVYRIAGQEADA